MAEAFAWDDSSLAKRPKRPKWQLVEKPGPFDGQARLRSERLRRGNQDAYPILQGIPSSQATLDGVAELVARM